MFNLPSELIKLIYEFDSTYSEIYKNIIKYFDNSPKFYNYDSIHNRYDFDVYLENYTISYNSSNYKKAFYKIYEVKKELD